MPSTLPIRYADLNLSFIPNPVRKDIGMLYNEDAVKQAVVNLVLTKHYERPFHSEIGCNVTALLFDNAGPMTAMKIQRSIQDVIQNFEPRVTLQSVNVVDQSDNNAYAVTITFYVLNVTDTVTVSFFLERVR